ncbi:hypothetical protein FEP68_05772 [Burkholderia multivorans]|nr:hypothetical protein [Burkholderia multivorans]
MTTPDHTQLIDWHKRCVRDSLADALEDERMRDADFHITIDELVERFIPVIVNEVRSQLGSRIT